MAERELQERVDVVLVHGVTDDGKGYQVVRQREDRIEVGAIKPLENGKPVHGEIVKLRPRSESPLLFDVVLQVDTRVDGDATGPTVDSGTDEAGRPGGRKGPVRVTNENYRSGWDGIWGARRKESAPN